MNQRVRDILTMLLVVSSLLAAACTAFGTPAYPGSKLTFEVTLTSKDFLPAIKQFIPAIPGIISEAAKSQGAMPVELQKILSEDVAKDVAGALAGLNSVSMTAFEMKSPNSEKLNQFYIQKMGLSKDWLPVMRGGDARGSAFLYVKPGLAATFALGVYPKGYVISRTSGPIDVARLAKAVAQLIPLAIEMGNQHKGQTGGQTDGQTGGDTQAASGINDTPYGLEGFDSAMGITWELHGRGKITIKAADGSSCESTSTNGDAGAPKLIIKTKTTTIEKEGYGTHEIPDENGKTFVIITIEPVEEPAK
jgi:hypothetical protein